MRKKRVLFILASLFLWVDLAMAQIARITGVVISQDDNEPVVGASVLFIIERYNSRFYYGH